MQIEQNSNRLKESIQLPVALVLLFLVFHLLRVTTNFDFIYWGIFPRKIYGLKGILTAPLIHGNWQHLISNSIPFLGLMMICMYFYRSVAIRGLIMIWILTGFSVWLLGNFFDDEVKNISHIGASGVVYGLVAFVFWNGIFVRSTPSIVLALIVLFLYGGMFKGIFPNQPGISWESHMFGGIMGIFTAYFYKDELLEQIELEKNAARTWAEEFGVEQSSFRTNEENGTQYFLPRDTFEKTKKEREQENYYDDSEET